MLFLGLNVPNKEEQNIHSENHFGALARNRMKTQAADKELKGNRRRVSKYSGIVHKFV